MKPVMLGLGAFAIWAASALDAAAAWNNVYQPTLFGRCRQRQTTAAYYYVPAVTASAPAVAYSPTCNTCNSCPSSPCQQCTTSYTQRCFYTPVTTYQSQSYYEAVTTYQTSYYYEPVTSYRTSYYYDACSCGYQAVSTPCTSYELRSKCCPVQSWVQRCCQVPVTTYQKSCYLEPKTTCCQTTTGPLIPMAGGAAPAVAAPAYGTAPAYGAAPSYGTPPSIIASPPANGNGQPPSIIVSPPSNGNGQPPVIKDNTAPSGPTIGNMSSFSPPGGIQAAPPRTAPVNQAPPPPAAPDVRLDRIVFGPESFVEGQIVRTDNSPKANVSLLFVSADNGKRETVTANGAGRFQVNLASGNWLVYVQGKDGTAQFHSRVNLQENQTARITVVN